MVQQAAAARYPMAQNMLGMCYENGMGVKKDFQKAVLLYRAAAVAQIPTAQHRLALCYLKGIGIRKDKSKALHWCLLARNHGHKGAEATLSTEFHHVSPALSSSRLQTDKSSASLADSIPAAASTPTGRRSPTAKPMSGAERARLAKAKAVQRAKAEVHKDDKKLTRNPSGLSGLAMETIAADDNRQAETMDEKEPHCLGNKSDAEELLGRNEQFRDEREGPSPDPLAISTKAVLAAQLGVKNPTGVPLSVAVKASQQLSKVVMTCRCTLAPIHRAAGGEAAETAVSTQCFRPAHQGEAMHCVAPSFCSRHVRVAAAQ